MDRDTLTGLRNIMLEILNEFVRICEENNLTYFLTAGTLLGAVRHKGFIPWDDDLDVAMPRNDYDKFIAIYNNIDNGDYYILSDKFPDKDIYYYEPFAKLCKKGTKVAEISRPSNSHAGIYIDIFPFDRCILFFLPLQTKLLKFVWRLYHFKTDYIKPKNKIKIFFGNLLCFILSERFIDKLHKKLYLIFNKYNTKYITFFSGKYGYKKETHEYNRTFPLSKISFEGKYYYAPNDCDSFLKEEYGNYMELPPVEERITHDPSYIIFNE
ncbi:MAG: LicD family protein [Treponema sp.]|jgi:lipopolysaccharide cholinephosphotransferase|nr:LicD family protein [Treponema sp.]